MPELPEVETTRRGIAPHLAGRAISAVTVRQPKLRWPVATAVAGLRQAPVRAVSRRAKFLLLDVPTGQVLIHLGMSGSLRVLPQGVPPGRHDHVDFLLDDGCLLRYTDPRRFGAILWTDRPGEHPLLDQLGPEPFDEAFSGEHLYRLSRRRQLPIKQWIMDNKVVVGVGNIYAQESLFVAGIHPSRQAGRISADRYRRLAGAIRDVLGAAIEAGGTTLRDFTRVDGQPGYFSQSLRVYGRGGLSCGGCGEVLSQGRHGQRATVWCPRCQT